MLIPVDKLRTESALALDRECAILSVILVRVIRTPPICVFIVTPSGYLSLKAFKVENLALVYAARDLHESLANLYV